MKKIIGYVTRINKKGYKYGGELTEGKNQINVTEFTSDKIFDSEEEAIKELNKYCKENNYELIFKSKIKRK